MNNRDYDFILSDLARRVKNVENQIADLSKNPDRTGEDWDNATLMQEWKICPRTAANYRQQGLESFKRGGRLYYSPVKREEFISKFRKGSNNE